jgi:hypothetical protein
MDTNYNSVSYVVQRVNLRPERDTRLQIEPDLIGRNAVAPGYTAAGTRAISEATVTGISLNF